MWVRLCEVLKTVPRKTIPSGLDQLLNAPYTSVAPILPKEIALLQHLLTSTKPKSTIAPACHTLCQVCSEHGFVLSHAEAGPITYKYMPDPHQCSLTTVQFVQHLYSQAFISESLFDQWMSVNGYQYQIGNSTSALMLWQARFEKLQRPTKHQKSECHQKSNRPNTRCLPFTPGLADFRHSALTISPCKVHAAAGHVQLKPQAKSSKMRFGRKQFKVLNKAFPFSSLIDKQNTNFDLASLAYHAYRKGMHSEVNLAFYTLPVGTINSIAVARLVHALGNPSYSLMHTLMTVDGACCMSPAVNLSYFKAVSTAVRRTSKLPSGEQLTLKAVSQLAYWELASGRSTFTSDWQQEITNRTQTKLLLRLPDAPPGGATYHTHQQYLEDIKTEINQVMSELVKPNIKWTSWAEAVKNRQAWVSSGSAGNAKVLVRNKQCRLDKPAFFETIPPQQVLAWLDSTPKIQARASEKFEQSKARAIYATGVVDYSIMSYAIMPAERRLHNIVGVESGLRSSDEIRCMLRKVTECGSRRECTMLDYADFNLQHSTEIQSQVFAAMAAILKDNSAHPDAIRACLWCRDALLNSWCKFPNDDRNYRVVQGLFSGVRATNFLNTILNVVYFRHASRWVHQTLNIKPISLYNVHQGDDVWITNGSRLWAICLFRTMHAIGYDFQHSKQLFDCGRGEFLRVMYQGPEVRGYLARALGALIIKPVQSSHDVAAADKASALNSQIMILARRGLSSAACAVVWDAIVPHAARSSLPGKGAHSIPLHILMKSKQSGGLDLGPPGTMSDPLSEKPTPPIPTIYPLVKEISKSVGTYMSADWLSVISEAFKKPMLSQAVLARLHESNLKGSIPAEDKTRALRNLIKQSQDWARNLAPSRVSRSYKQWESWCSSKLHNEGLWFSRELEDLFRYAPVKRAVPVHGPVPTIMTAIATSPFRDINTARQALATDVVQAARTAICMSRDRNLASSAMGAINYLNATFGSNLLTHILNGLEGPGPTYEAIFNPIYLSWITQLCMSRSIRVALQLALFRPNDFDQVLKQTYNQALSTAVHCKRFVLMNAW